MDRSESAFFVIIESVRNTEAKRSGIILVLMMLVC